MPLLWVTKEDEAAAELAAIRAALIVFVFIILNARLPKITSQTKSESHLSNNKGSVRFSSGNKLPYETH